MIHPDFPIQIIRTERKKTASITVIDGQVQAVVPKLLSEEKVSEIIRNRSPWIRHKLHLQSKIVRIKPKEYVSGECFSYLGKNYRLKLVPNGLNEVKLKEGYLVLGSSVAGPSPAGIRDSLIEWYRHHALKRLTEKTNRYSAILGVVPTSVGIKDFKSKWGTCSTRGEISYNWRVVIAPHRIVDYVVVHELVHLSHLDHSSTFWRQVSHIIPEYKEAPTGNVGCKR